MSTAAPEEWLVAHRGYPWRYPENSLAGMQAVLEAGARLVEFDVQITRDGHPMVSHDDSLQRVAGQGICVTTAARTEFDSIPVGEHERFGDAFQDSRMADVAEMLELIDAYPGTRVFVDIKGASVAAFGEHSTADAVLAKLSSVRSCCIVLCEHVGVLARVRAGGVPIGWVVDAWAPGTAEQARAQRPDFLFSARADARPDEPGALTAVPGPRLAIYDVNDADTALALRARGHLIETDCFPELATACRSAGPR